MKTTIHHVRSFIRRLDVSPLCPGGLSKEVIILFWGINAVLFLGSGFHDIYFSAHSDGLAFCTVAKKVSKSDLYTEDTQIVHFSEYIIISSYDFELPHFDAIVIPTQRAPPIKLIVNS